MRKRNHTEVSSLFFTLGIVTLFIGGFLLLVVFGATSYRNMYSSEKENGHTRELLSYLSTTIQSNREGSVYVREYGEADSTVIIVQESNSAYAFRIYVSDGYLVEDYGSIDGPLWPEDANRLGENTTLTVRMVKENLLEIRTDAGVVYANTENYEGGQ